MEKEIKTKVPEMHRFLHLNLSDDLSCTACLIECCCRCYGCRVYMRIKEQHEWGNTLKEKNWLHNSMKAKFIRCIQILN